MTNDDIGYLSATDLVSRVRAKELSPVEVVRGVLERMESVEPTLNAMASVLSAEARREARGAEARLMGGDDLPSLLGVTVTVKDLTDVPGAPCERGSRAFRGQVSQTEAPIVRRLRGAGAVVVGKTTTTELAWSALSHSPLTGTTHNPWRWGYTAGGSSSGAGAAAAAGYGALHQGSDGAGSIRVPASFCGVFGLKPTFGRVPYAPHVNLDSISHIGPITRTVRDAALMLEVMAGPDPRDHTSSEAPPLPYASLLPTGSPKGRRIAFSPDLGFARVDPEVADLVRRAATVFARDLGADIEEVTPPWASQGSDLVRFLWPAMMSGLRGMLPAWEADMDPGLVACIKAGLETTSAEYFEYRARKLAYIRDIALWFEDWDFLLTPAVSVACFPARALQPPDWPSHAWDWMSWAEFSYPFNFAHNPAASIPCGFTRDGRPVGVQIVGRRFDDLGVLQASAAFEEAQPWAQARPSLPA